jgi:uncharacterized protein YciI
MAWFLCLRRDLRPRSEWTVGLPAHLEWMRDRHGAGDIVLSGPAPGRGLGIYLIRAADEPAAAAIAATDPYTTAGQTGFELIPWDIHQMLGIGSFDPPQRPK